MNRIQKLILIVGLLLVALSCLYVPWHELASDRGDTFIFDSGYRFLLALWEEGVAPAIDYGRIVLTWIAVGTVTGAAWLIAGARKS